MNASIHCNSQFGWRIYPVPGKTSTFRNTAVALGYRMYANMLENALEVQEAGLVLEQSFGEHFQPLTGDSMRMILVARKPL